MKKKKYHSTKHSLFPQGELDAEDDESWQVSYLDIITIVLGFLIILLSVSQITKTTSLSTLFGRLSDETEYFTTPIENIQEELVELLNAEIEAGELEIIRDLNDLRIRFNSDNLYASGEALIQEGSENLLNRILIAFQQTTYNDFQIDVEGHTDNVPIATAGYPSNWELSTARASNIVRYFTGVGIPAERLKASGYADSRPIIEYDSLGFPYAASKERNRRVVLRLYYNTEAIMQENQIQEFVTESESPAQPIQEEVIISETPAIVTLADQNQINEQIDDLPEEQSPDEPEAEAPSVSEEEPAPVNEEPLVILPSPVEENTLPNFLRVDERCVYSLQIDGQTALNRTFQSADNFESRSGLDLQITYNNSEFSIRTQPVTSFVEAMRLQNQLSSQLNNARLGIIHQCYNNTLDRPGAIKYQIQFGAFQNQTNALNYTIELLDKFGIQAYMNRVGDTFNILAGPYDTRESVLQNLNAFREAGVTSNIFIRHEPETVSNYEFAYQIQIASFSTLDEATNLASQISSEAGINARVVELIEGRFAVMTGQSSSLSQTHAVFDRLRGFGNNVNPVIFFLEHI
ncbi:MAG: SPOR domain-containing protein [Balneolales bacterium]|nr:SPOR domain-containing protein [Balneolales bacterium]